VYPARATIPGFAARMRERGSGLKAAVRDFANQGKRTMNRTLTILAIGASLFAGIAAPAQAAPDVSLARLDCGTPQAPTAVNQRFSDIYAYGDLKLQFVFSCYLIKHGDEYMLWDTGHATTAPNVAPKVSLVDFLAKIDVKPEQIKYVGISHYHADHTGQIASFPKATLLIGAREWDAISSPKPAEGVNFKPFEGWIKGENKVEPQGVDKDVFGDGTVIMLRTPGHTPGHSSLLVKLPQMGPVIITGDAVHFRENYDTVGVPSFNYDRAQTVASIERLKKIASNLKATVVIQHDARDIEKLPVFPEFAK
jgi:glyoxylase-like metal-dependent hydrolase (beta-lactamase superfamily II)